MIWLINGKFLYHSTMVGTEIIERTVEVGGNAYRDDTSRSIEWTTADQRGGGVPIALTNHEWVRTRYSRIGELIGCPAVER